MVRVRDDRPGHPSVLCHGCNREVGATIAQVSGWPWEDEQERDGAQTKTADSRQQASAVVGDQSSRRQVTFGTFGGGVGVARKCVSCRPASATATSQAVGPLDGIELKVKRGRLLRARHEARGTGHETRDTKHAPGHMCPRCHSWRLSQPGHNARQRRMIWQKRAPIWEVCCFFPSRGAAPALHRPTGGG